MLVRTGQDLVWLLKILPGFEYLIVLVLCLLFVKAVLLAMARLATAPRLQRRRRKRTIAACLVHLVSPSIDEDHW
jgi:hypothetical protein